MWSDRGPELGREFWAHVVRELHDNFSPPKITPKLIGDLFCVSDETIRRLMAGARPGTQVLEEIGRAFGISADWLLYGRGQIVDPMAGPIVDMHQASGAVMDLIQKTTPAESESDENEVLSQMMGLQARQWEASLSLNYFPRHWVDRAVTAWNVPREAITGHTPEVTLVRVSVPAPSSVQSQRAQAYCGTEELSVDQASAAAYVAQKQLLDVVCAQLRAANASDQVVQDAIMRIVLGPVHESRQAAAGNE